MVMTISDTELVMAVRQGDRNSFGLLMDRHHSMVHALCLRIAGNVPDAVELSHDSFVEAFIKLEQLREPSKFKPWLRQIALNICRMWYRRRKGELLEPMDVLPEVAGAPHEDPHQNLQMAGALSDLSAPHRLVLALHYFEGMPYDELASFLDVPIGTVMSRLHRARQALKATLNGQVNIREHQEEDDMSPDEQFIEVVQAEISLLLSEFGADESSRERLTVILRRSPDRFVQLLREATDEGSLENLAILIPHLGSEAIKLTLDAHFGDDPQTGAQPGAGIYQRRIGNRQGTGCTDDPRPGPACGWRIYPGELRRNPFGVIGKRIIRPSQGRVHWCSG